jgi:hypothetical protein
MGKLTIPFLVITKSTTTSKTLNCKQISNVKCVCHAINPATLEMSLIHMHNCHLLLKCSKSRKIKKYYWGIWKDICYMRGSRWRSGYTNQQVTGSIPDGVIGIFH